MLTVALASVCAAPLLAISIAVAAIYMDGDSNSRA